MTRILLVEDEPAIAAGVQDDLELEGYLVEVVTDGGAAAKRGLQGQYDLILLDVMLPVKDGFQICRELRRGGVNTPIILLTARTQEAEKVLGLQLGADDYVTKPFSPRELEARVRAVLRRHARDADTEILQVGDLTLDLPRLRTDVAGRPVSLTATEFQLLTALARQPGRVFTRAQLLDAIHGVAFESYERAIDAHVKNIRRKIEPDPRTPRYLLTVYGVGYRLTDA